MTTALAPTPGSARDLTGRLPSIEAFAQMSEEERVSHLVTCLELATDAELVGGWIAAGSILAAERAGCTGKALVAERTRLLRDLGLRCHASPRTMQTRLRVASLVTPDVRARYRDLTWEHFLHAVTRTGREGDTEPERTERVFAWLDRAQSEDLPPPVMRAQIEAELGKGTRTPPMEPRAPRGVEAFLDSFEEGLAVQLWQRWPQLSVAEWGQVRHYLRNWLRGLLIAAGGDE